MQADGVVVEHYSRRRIGCTLVPPASESGVIVIDWRTVKGALRDDGTSRIRRGHGECTAFAHVSEKVAEVSVVIHQPVWLESGILQPIDHQAFGVWGVIQLSMCGFATVAPHQAYGCGTAVA